MSPNMFFLIPLALLATSAHGQQTAINIDIVNLKGRVCCTTTGNCPGQGLAGANATLRCGTLGGASVVVSNSTTLDGLIQIVADVRSLNLTNATAIPCIITVQSFLGPTVCAILANSRVLLTSGVQSVGGVVVGALSTVQNIIPTIFNLIPII